MATPAEITPAGQPPRQPRTAQLLALIGIAALVAIVLAMLADATRERIARNEQTWIMQRLDALVPAQMHDNDLLDDRIEVAAADLLGTNRPVAIYRARRGGLPVAAILRPVAPDGYRGPIELLVAISSDPQHDGELIGVQIIQHNETPGLGDAFEAREAGWLARFGGTSLRDPPQHRWTVRKDGGDFDQFTGATITPRAIVKAVRRALEYYATNRDRIWKAEHDSVEVTGDDAR